MFNQNPYTLGYVSDVHYVIDMFFQLGISPKTTLSEMHFRLNMVSIPPLTYATQLSCALYSLV